MVEEVLKKLADRAGIRPLKSDNIKLGDEMPLPDRTTGIITEEVEKL